MPSKRKYFRADYSQHPSEPCDGVCIPLTLGYHAIIDEEDFAVISQQHWRAYVDSETVYAVSSGYSGNKQMNKLDALEHQND